ncbi:putative bifunctional diguanylate cyclase/phosphodiesterase [Marinobacterium arenosum]|uniref:putative bifunctional diguanylate cyclase/phosphodiesterase n=1 Tax=Marinobacterium arenosum TaxID=2862496 RepID=UPI001C93C2C3|nr:EAL domain-containing protein [Marinobacterium arenosum]MBY4676399.1 EAL domain-containing protein [Marinobacterium arenosum]
MLQKLRSVQFKFFLTLLLGTLLALVLAYLYSSQRAQLQFEQQLEDKQRALRSYASLLAEPVWNFNEMAISNIQRSLMQDQDILRVQVHDEGGHLIAELRSDLFDDQPIAFNIEEPIIYSNAHITQRAGTFSVTVGKASLNGQVRNQISELMLMLGLLILVLALSVWWLHSRMIGAPLRLLMEAIGRSGNGREFAQVDQIADDEFGEIFSAFNQMQTAIADKHQALAASERRFRTLYHSTPALLFSMARDGSVQHASEYCLSYLGLEGVELRGRRLEQLFDNDDPADLQQMQTQLWRQGRVRGWAVTIRGERNEPLELLLDAVCDPQAPELGALAVMSDITSLKRAHRLIDHQANYDELTELPNRTMFRKTLQRELNRQAHDQGMLAVLYIDLDHFKCVNDTFGHATGDQLLQVAARRLQSVVRPRDLVARLGGDEFAMVLSGLDDPGYAEQVASRILTRLTTPYHLQDSEIYVSGSVGIAMFPTDAECPEALLQKADIAMYRAKQEGRNRFGLFLPEHHQAAQERLQMEAVLRRALDEQLFELHYQPIVELASGRLVGAEALIRLNHPQLGLVSPAQFIPLAEESGLIVPIGNWVLQQALAQLTQWRDRVGDAFYLSVNVSSRQFQSSQFLRTVEQTLARYKLEPSRLMVEITESLLMQDSDSNERVMERLSRMGCRIAIDDFGTGYSALSYLQKFPLSTLKIDRSFIHDCVECEVHRGLVEAIVAMGRSLKLTVIIEGIENDRQLVLLNRMQCQLGQGYHFSRPLDAQAFAERYLAVPVV